MKYAYQKNNRYFAQTANDVRDIVEQELIELEAKDTSLASSGVYFNATQDVLYTINYNSHLCNRIIAPLLTFDCHSDRYLYKTALKIEWDDFINEKQTFAVYASVSNSAIKHSKYAALKLKDAIADYFREKKGVRPSVDTIDPDLWINLHIRNNKATISIDTSGGSLHRRGYRKRSVSAPMIETLAAAIIRLSGWDGVTPLYDPFCGSGTLLFEACLYASNTPPAFLRQKFGFEMLPDFDKNIWIDVKNNSKQKMKKLSPGLISGSDISEEAVKIAMENRDMIDDSKSIHIKQKDVFQIGDLNNTFIICNPPYGLRLKKGQDLSHFYKRLGDFLKQKCTGSTAVIYFGERKYIKNIGLKPAWKKPLANGGLDGRLVKYELY